MAHGTAIHAPSSALKYICVATCPAEPSDDAAGLAATRASRTRACSISALLSAISVHYDTGRQRVAECSPNWMSTIQKSLATTKDMQKDVLVPAETAVTRLVDTVPLTQDDVSKVPVL